MKSPRTECSGADLRGFVSSAVKSELHAVELDAGAHGGGEHEALDVGTLGGSGLCLDDSIHEGVQVLSELFLAEAYLADGAVADIGLINTILNLTGFNIGNSLGNIHGNGAALGVGHQALRAEDTTDAADNAHHIGGCYADIESKPVFGLDLLYHILITYEISACFECFASLIALCEDENADGLTGAVGQNDCAADLLICVTGVNTEADMGFDGLVKLCLTGGDDDFETLFGIVQLLLIEKLYAFVILLAMLHNQYLASQSTTTTPMLRAVPAIMLIAVSRLAALRSGILSSAISLI